MKEVVLFDVFITYGMGFQLFKIGAPAAGVVAACLLLARAACDAASSATSGAGDSAGSGAGGGAAGPARLAPWFVVEPPSLVRYAAAAGARLRCVARGEPPPALAWLADDAVPIDDRPGLRRVHSNGTLELLPTREPAPATLRCRAANAHGVALSREVTLQPVLDTGWEAELSAPAAVAGGVAALACGAAAPAQGLIAPAVWYRGDQVIDLHRPSPESRYLVAGETLLIRGVTAADAGAYSCLARHAVTAHTRRSHPRTLLVTESPWSSAPRLTAAAALSVPAGAAVCLPCAAPDHPPPHYTWYREVGGRLQAVEGAEGAWAWAGGAALCLPRVALAHQGLWLCKAYNVYGDATAQVRLEVQDTLTVTVSESVVVADSGSTVRLNCSASDPQARLTWLHDGAAAGGAGGELVLRGVARAHRGLYQCVARRGADNAHADVELRLGDSAPELHYTFIEHALRAGGAVSLRCGAAGAPPPRFIWLLDAQPLDQQRVHHRYSISEETSAVGDVVSTLNMSAAAAADGGRYTCRAANRLGAAEHSARLNIYGPPSIRALGPVRVVAGANTTVFCPYAGYPISSVSWWVRGAAQALGGAGRVSARGAELRLRPALPPDAGHYACAVAAPAGASARRDIEIQVRNPPKISPFIFSSELTEGSSVQVLCGVSSGDKPMYFSWMKDGAPLPSNLQIEEKSLNEFSLLMFSDLSARHSGDYTCRVSNHAATVNYTARLSVKVAPAWQTEPLDVAVLLGAPLHVQCAARGHPAPALTWYTKIGDGASLATENSDQWQIIESMMWEDKSSTGTHTVRALNGTLSAAVSARSHQGVYRCIADNGVGPPLVKHINLTVHEPAHFEGSGGNVSSVRGQSASLTCHAIGDAPLTVHWTHMGTRLDLNSYRWTVSEVRTADGLRSALQLRAAERADAGEYRCHAHNQFGRSEALMYLHVEEPPEAPQSIKLGGVGSRWVRVVWRSWPGLGVYYSALFTALHALPGVESKHTASNLTLDALGNNRLDVDGFRILSARLDGLRPAAAYSLRLAAANHVGQSPHSDPLLFTTLEEPPTASPQNVRVRPANDGELHISWSAPPQDDWNGELLGYVVSWRELSHIQGAGAGSEVRRAGAATAPGWASGELTAGGLRDAARYAVLVRAYNRAGAGPPSPTVYATTSDGVAEWPPSSVFCEGVSARALRVRWQQPPAATNHALRGYELHYAPLHFSPSWSGLRAQTARAGAEGEATLQGLRAATNYSVSVRARSDQGLGPLAAPVYCATREDVPGAPAAIRALPAGAGAVRVSWLPPAEYAGRVTHYTLYTRELGKVGGEWSQRVETDAEGAEGAEEAEEAWREVSGLRERTVYEFWARAATAAGAGPPSRAVTAAPANPVAVRISSLPRVVGAARGARVRLRCAAVGAPPLRWRWAPPDPTHTVTDMGDLIIHKAEWSGNYTCTVRGGGGTDATTFALVVRAPPAAPAPRLLRAARHTLQLAWDPPPDHGAPLIGYTVFWLAGAADAGEAAEAGGSERWARVSGAEAALVLRGLACGALYRVSAQAHNALGASPRSSPLLARTLGDKATPAPAKEFVWANSSALRLNLLAWRARCPVAAWAVALRPAAPGPAAAWVDLPADGESAMATNLRPGTWYDIRVVARSAAGNAAAMYRAATDTANGERLGEPVEMAQEVRGHPAGPAPEEAWRAGLAPLLLAAGLAALLVALAGAVVARRRAAACARACSPQPRAPHAQLYSTEPGKRGGKALTPPNGDLHEISPYATFSMAGGCTGPGAGAGAGAGAVAGAGAGAGAAAGACALHLRTFGRAEPRGLAAPPPRPNLLAHANEYARGRDSDSESSGSPCAACAAACAADLYRLPAACAAADLADTLPAMESSADDTSYSAGGRGACAVRLGRGGAERPERVERGKRTERVERGRQLRGRRRRDHARHASVPTVRYFASGAPLQPLLPRQKAL